MLDARGNSYVMTDYFGKEELTRDDISNWVKDYYDERGWDRATGYPTHEKLRTLGLPLS